MIPARRVSLALAVASHLAAAVALWVASSWEIERLPVPARREVTIAPPSPVAGERASMPRAAPAAMRPVDPRAPRAAARRRVAAAPRPTHQPAAADLATTDVGGGAGGASVGGGGPARRVVVPPRPVGRYDHLRIRAPVSRRGAGVVRVLLDVDARGRVVRVVKVSGVDPEIDRQALALARLFRFFPARDAADRPIPTRVAWTFHVDPGR